MREPRYIAARPYQRVHLAKRSAHVGVVDVRKRVAGAHDAVKAPVEVLCQAAKVALCQAAAHAARAGVCLGLTEHGFAQVGAAYVIAQVGQAVGGVARAYAAIQYALYPGTLERRPIMPPVGLRRALAPALSVYLRMIV